MVLLFFNCCVSTAHQLSLFWIKLLYWINAETIYLSCIVLPLLPCGSRTMASLTQSSNHTVPKTRTHSSQLVINKPKTVEYCFGMNFGKVGFLVTLEFFWVCCGTLQPNLLKLGRAELGAEAGERERETYRAYRQWDTQVVGLLVKLEFGPN